MANTTIVLKQEWLDDAEEIARDAVEPLSTANTEYISYVAGETQESENDTYFEKQTLPSVKQFEKDIDFTAKQIGEYADSIAYTGETLGTADDDAKAAAEKGQDK